MERDDVRQTRVLGRRPAGRRLFLWLFSAAMILVAGTAFAFKLIEFVHTATRRGPDALGSFLIPVLNYLLVAAGFGLLFLWAYFRGQFRDVERPKYRMLQMQRQIDAEEAAAAGRPPRS
jgi:hypothetical protein